MFKSSTTAPIANVSNEVHSEAAASILELLPKVEHIGSELETKVSNLNSTKKHLFDLLSQAIGKLPDEHQMDLLPFIWQLMTIDDVLSECITPKDFCNLEDFFYYAKELLTLSNI